ncbi:response regulator [Rubellimicrobium rubrum]|uniref:Response regulator n=1 Tax=Rubellimicrobium rubrum TaxID=2585369 RepID=A0A5C4MZ64_9RHOB|nr:response regulator [Rubellimicrobium rubrum]TNC49433.1 response regulator [Rubellimicrobium rubrum]
MPVADPECLVGLRVLVVEDEMLIAMTIEDMLEDLGCSVLGHASSVEDALERVNRERPDAVTLDGNLAGQMSSPVAERLADLGIPYVVITGYIESTLADPILSKAPRLSKPFTSASLAHAAALHLCRP